MWWVFWLLLYCAGSKQRPYVLGYFQRVLGKLQARISCNVIYCTVGILDWYGQDFNWLASMSCSLFLNGRGMHFGSRMPEGGIGFLNGVSDVTTW